MLITIIGSIAGGIALLLGIGLLYRLLRQLRQARALAIRTPNKIQEGQFVQIGALAQWIQIRGENRDNPILLVIHGGPGIAFSAFTPRFRAWERDFTIVQWDQPGAGKTASRNGRAGSDSLTIESMAQDGIQVTEWVLRHLNQRKLILFGASWGTVLGTLMVKRRSEHFWAYVGAGQFVDAKGGESLGYALALERAQRLGDDKTVKVLQTIGPPPYTDPKTLGMERRALGRVGVETFPTLRDLLSAMLFSPGYSLKDGIAFFRGIQSSVAKLWKPIMAYDARQSGTTFETPLFFFQGALDLYTPAHSVQEYFATLQAPHKELLLWEHEGHLTFLSNPEMVLNELVARVRPLAAGGPVMQEH
ncbi:MAG TPA: alpha/beta hydrolase [Ktedonobacterales bacterium]|nr:alpha/beta hydrolase [Ktedonobacterales bacterium]